MSERYFERPTARQYKPQPELEAFSSDTQMAEDAFNGSTALLAALATGHGPDRFIWPQRPGAANWTANRESQTTGMMVHRVSLIQEREAHADSLRVYREPCPVCATRADIGCKHRRLA